MSKNNPRRSNGYRRTQQRKYWRGLGLPCALCGQPIDYELPAGDPQSFEIDEIVPVSRYYEGGYTSPEQCALDISNQQPVHRHCNQVKGNGSGGRRAAAKITAFKGVKTSRKF